MLQLDRSNVVRAVAALLLLATSAAAQFPAPELYRVFPSGGRPGSAVQVRVGGENLDGPQTLLFSHPGIYANAKFKPSNEFESAPAVEPDLFDVAIDASVTPGIYECRLAGLFGVSNPRTFVVDDREQTQEVEPNDRMEQATAIPAECAVHGRSNYQGDVDYFLIEAIRGQRLAIVVDAQKIDSRFQPSVTVLSPSGKELVAKPYQRTDAHLAFLVEEDGPYKIALHDIGFSGGEDYGYRLAATSRPFVTSVFPSVARLNEDREYQLMGFNLPGGQPVAGSEPLSIVKRSLRFTQASPSLNGRLFPNIAAAVAESGTVAMQLPSPFGDSNTVVLPLADASIVFESDKSIEPALPAPNAAIEPSRYLPGYCEIVGEFKGDQDEDRFVIHCKAGESFDIDVVCERSGYSADPRLRLGKRVVQPDGAAQFQQLAESDDVDQTVIPEFRTISHDPGFRFNAPEEADYEIVVSNRASVAESGVPYRLRVLAPRPGFQLAVTHLAETTAPKDANYEARVRQCVLRPGGSAALQVFALRSPECTGPIELRLQGLPPGITARNLVIPSGARSTSVVLTASENAAAWVGAIQVFGTTRLGDVSYSQKAWANTLVWPARPFNGEFPAAETRVSSDVYLSVAVDTPAPFEVAWEHRPMWKLTPGAKVQVPFQIKRRNGYAGPVNIVAAGTPDKFQVAPVTVPENTNAGVLEVTASGDAPTIETSIQLLGSVDAAPFRRNPQAETAAQARQQQLAQKFTELQAALAAAKQEKEAKAAVIAESDMVVGKANAARPQLEGAVASLQQQASAARKNVEDAKAALAAAEQTFAEMEKKAAEEAAKLQLLAADVQTAEQKKAEAAQQQTALAQKEAETQSVIDRLAALQKEVAASLEAATKAAAPANIKVTMISAVLPVRVVPFPAQAQTDALPLVLRAGETRDWKAVFTREFGFAGEIRMAVEGLPSGVQANVTTLPADKQEALVQWVLAPDAQPAETTANLKLTCDFNGAAREMIIPLPLRILPKP